MNKQQLASLNWEYRDVVRDYITTVEYKDFIFGLYILSFVSEKEVTYLNTKLGRKKGRSAT